MAKSDAQLMADFQRGNESAFAELVARHKTPLINFFYKLLWDRHLAEDCSQEVFCRVFRHRNDYVPSAGFSTYLYRIGRNLWIDRYRAQKHAPGTISMDADVDDEGHTRGEFLAARQHDPSYRSEVSDEITRLKGALDGLAPELKETLILVKYQGLKYNEAADVQGIPVGTVRSRIHAAIEQLRITLQIDVRQTEDA